MEVFVEVAHYIRQNYPLIPYEEITLLQNKHDKLAEKIHDIEESMVKKDELSDFIKLFGRISPHKNQIYHIFWQSSRQIYRR